MIYDHYVLTVFFFFWKFFCFCHSPWTEREREKKINNFKVSIMFTVHCDTRELVTYTWIYGESVEKLYPRAFVGHSFRRSTHTSWRTLCQCYSPSFTEAVFIRKDLYTFRTHSNVLISGVWDSAYRRVSTGHTRNPQFSDLYLNLANCP